MPIYPKRPQVVLVVGVNGSGKTTTIGKLASQFRAAGKKVVIAAGDTFRAAAVEQLQIWGERAGVPVMTAPQGSDPASLAFDAMARAEAEGADLLLIDTAGRLQNRDDLMAELAKIVRVIRKRDPDAPHNTLLVLDATTGQNALSQVEIFRRIADVTGLVMTKLDGTAKGGVLVALADRFGLPIHAIGVGESIDDLAPVRPRGVRPRADRPLRRDRPGSPASRAPPTAGPVALALALLAAVCHAVFGALQKGRHDPWLTRGAIDICYALMALPVALFLVPLARARAWAILAGAMVIHIGYKLAQAMAYSRGAFTVVYPSSAAPARSSPCWPPAWCSASATPAASGSAS